MKARAGFTIVEVVIIIAVLGILVTITSFGFGTVQQNSRDAKRAADALVIADALENYFNENGEYPGCSAMTASANDLRTNTLKNINETVLVTPKAPSGSSQSIKCDDLTSTSQDDFYAYIGDSSSTCQSGNSCNSWVLKYQVEGSDTIAQIQSRRQNTTLAAGAPTGLTMTASLIGTTARGTAGGGSCSGSETLERQIRYRSTSTTTEGSWSSWVATDISNVPANEGHQYTFQQQARCTSGMISSAWTTSGVDSTVRPISTSPAAVTVTVSDNGSTIQFVRSDATCPTGTTVSYQHRSIRDYNYDSGWLPSTASPNYNWNTSNQGFEFTTQVQAQCSSEFSTGPWGGTGQISYIRPIDAPTGAPSNFTHTVASDRQSREFAWTPPTCTTGSATQAQHRWNSYIAPGSMTWSHTGTYNWAYGTTTTYASNWSSVGAWTPKLTINLNSGQSIGSNITVRHRVQYICVNTYTGRTSAWGTAVTSPNFST